ncbi:MAG: TonB family protein [Candidatus Gastranaerophilales bacterium]|nr:TonB family protein [Candidatus Gastranaerophilales bacterium]
MANLEKKIKSNWKPQKYHKSYKIVVLFILNKDGYIESINITSSTGNKAAQDYAIETLYKSQPFEKFPKEYIKRTLPIEFSFDYNIINSSSKKNSKSSKNVLID